MNQSHQLVLIDNQFPSILDTLSQAQLQKTGNTYHSLFSCTTTLFHLQNSYGSFISFTYTQIRQHLGIALSSSQLNEMW